MESSFVLMKELNHGSTKELNVLLFSDDGKYLISGGDDERLRIWNTETLRCDQILENKNWGQITSVTWTYQDLPSREIFASLSVGSARGYVSLYPMELRGAKPFTRPAVMMSLFTFNDSVERQTYDKVNNRLVLASQSGELKVYSLDGISLKLIWAGSIGTVIPSGLFLFGGGNQSLLTIGLESSELACRDAARSGPPLWTKSLSGGVGHAALSFDQAILLVDNLSTGNFDVYQVADDYPLRSLPVGAKRRFPRQCTFIGESKLAICGSDTNKVYIVDVSSNYVVQTLITGKDPRHLSQTVGVSPASSGRVFVAAASQGSVYLWEKRLLPTEAVSVATPQLSLLQRLRAFVASDAMLLLSIMAAASLGHWFPQFWEIAQLVAEKVTELLPTSTADDMLAVEDMLL